MWERHRRGKEIWQGEEFARFVTVGGRPSDSPPAEFSYYNLIVRLDNWQGRLRGAHPRPPIDIETAMSE
jgi:hypothetical protein